jgi:hypothetical protein
MQKYGTLLAPVLDASCEAQRGDGLPPASMAGSSAGGSHTSVSFPRRLYHFFTIRQRQPPPASTGGADRDGWRDKRAAMQRRDGITFTSEVGFRVGMKYRLRGSSSLDSYTELSRQIAIAGGYNLRDIGGYTTRDQRRTRWRTLLRSASLHRLTPESWRMLRDHGVRTIIDLRRTSETGYDGYLVDETFDMRYQPAV